MLRSEEQPAQARAHERLYKTRLLNHGLTEKQHRHDRNPHETSKSQRWSSCGRRIPKHRSHAYRVSPKTGTDGSVRVVRKLVDMTAEACKPRQTNNECYRRPKLSKYTIAARKPRGMQYHVMSCHSISCHANPCHSMPCHVIPCPPMSSHVMRFHTM